MSNYNFIAPIYDYLAQLVYGKDTIRAASAFIPEIPDGSKILILGGGTGKILKILLKSKPNCKVDYVEASEKMLEISRSKIDNSNVKFIHGTESWITEKYDVIITAFYLDLFPYKKLIEVSDLLYAHIKPNGLLLAADFYPIQTLRARVLYALMKYFFKISTGLESSKLYDFNALLQKQFKQESVCFYNNGFIFSALYRKLK